MNRTDFGKGLTVLLPGRLDYIFADIFESMGFKAIWSGNEAFLESLVRDNDFDVAFEWQYGDEDHTVLDLVKKYKPHVPVILYLNWKSKITIDDVIAGYFDAIAPGSKIERLKEITDRIRALKGSQL